MVDAILLETKPHLAAMTKARAALQVAVDCAQAGKPDAGKLDIVLGRWDFWNQDSYLVCTSGGHASLFVKQRSKFHENSDILVMVL